MTTTNIIPSISGTPFAGGFYVARFLCDDCEYALVVSPKNEGEIASVYWGKCVQDVAEARTFNDGLSNTRGMEKAGSDVAAQIFDLVINDHNDWYLPSRDELELCYRSLKPSTQENWASFRDGDNPSSVPTGYPYTEQSPHQTLAPAFQAGGVEAFNNDWYLSSTQYSPGNAWIQTFDGGFQSGGRKDVARRARAVRRVKVTP